MASVLEEWLIEHIADIASWKLINAGRWNDKKGEWPAAVLDTFDAVNARFRPIYFSPRGLFVAPSTIGGAGFGAFTFIELQKGFEVTVFGGYQIPEKEYDYQWKNQPDIYLKKGAYIISRSDPNRDGEVIVIDPTNDEGELFNPNWNDNVAPFINQPPVGKKANCYTLENPSTDLSIIPCRNIPAMEELFMIYGERGSSVVGGEALAYPIGDPCDPVEMGDFTGQKEEKKEEKKRGGRRRRPSKQRAVPPEIRKPFITYAEPAARFLQPIVTEFYKRRREELEGKALTVEEKAKYRTIVQYDEVGKTQLWRNGFVKLPSLQSKEKLDGLFATVDWKAGLYFPIGGVPIVYDVAQLRKESQSAGDFVRWTDYGYVDMNEIYDTKQQWPFRWIREPKRGSRPNLQLKGGFYVFLEDVPKSTELTVCYPQSDHTPPPYLTAC